MREKAELKFSFFDSIKSKEDCYLLSRKLSNVTLFPVYRQALSYIPKLIAF